VAYRDESDLPESKNYDSKTSRNGNYSVYRGVRYYFSVPVVHQNKKSPKALIYRGVSYTVD